MSYDICSKDLLNKYIDKTEALIDEINNAPTTVTVSGTKYYVSADGCDCNDGLSPDTPWKSVTKVSTFDGFKPGDGIFFKRGDTFRFDHFEMHSNLTYSAYGEGNKPLLIASVNASGKDKWIATEYPNIYAYAEKIPGDRENIAEVRDVGNICIDGGRCWGIKVQETKEGNRHDIGTVSNGLETYTTTNGRFRGEIDLDHNLEYFHNWDTDTLYFYCDMGNPGEVFESIELALRGRGINMGEWIETEHHGPRRSVENIVVDNLEIRGTGSHALYSCFCKNSLVQYCVFKWIGGAIQGKYIFDRNYSTRFGDACECCFADNHTVRYCYASQVYDCCFTIQWGAPSTMVNIDMHHNVSEFCNTGLEIWNNGGVMKNMDLHDNITRYNGYGFSNQRGGKDGNFFYGAYWIVKESENNHVRNNLNYLSFKFTHLLRATGAKYYNFHDNVYVMENGKFLGGIVENPATSEGERITVEYTEENIRHYQDMGFEPGTEFYLLEDNLLGDMTKLATKSLV